MILLLPFADALELAFGAGGYQISETHDSRVFFITTCIGIEELTSAGG